MLVTLPEIIAALLLCLFGIFDPFLGVLGLLVFIVGQPEQVFHIVGTLHVEKIAGILIVIGFLLKSDGRLRLSPVGASLLAFYGAVICSLPLSIYISHSIDFTIDFGKTIILTLLIINVVNTRKRLRVFLLVYVLLLGYLAISGMANFYMGSLANHYFDGGLDRLIGLTSDSNAPDSMAISLAASMPLLAIFLAHGKWRWRLVFAALCAGSLWGMLLTGTRTALYVLLVVAVIYALRSRRRVTALGSMAIIFFGLWAALPSSIKARYVKALSAQGLAQDNTYQERLLAWEGGWRMFLHNPLTGIGVANYNDANGLFYWPGGGRRRYIDAHSLFFKLIGELGIVGLVAFFLFVAALVRTNVRLRRRLVARGEPFWLCAYPRAANYVILILLLVGYGAHDVYRSTWYVLAGMTGAVALILDDEKQSLANAPAEPAADALAPPLAWDISPSGPQRDPSSLAPWPR